MEENRAENQTPRRQHTQHPTHQAHNPYNVDIMGDLLDGSLEKNGAFY